MIQSLCTGGYWLQRQSRDAGSLCLISTYRTTVCDIIALWKGLVALGGLGQQRGEIKKIQNATAINAIAMCIYQKNHVIEHIAIIYLIKHHAVKLEIQTTVCAIAAEKLDIRLQRIARLSTNLTSAKDSDILPRNMYNFRQPTT